MTTKKENWEQQFEHINPYSQEDEMIPDFLIFANTIEMLTK